MTGRERAATRRRQGSVRHAWLVITLVAIVAGCGMSTTSPSAPPGPTGTTSATPSDDPADAIAPTRICDTVQAVDPPPFSCTDVIGRVLLAMGPDAALVQAAWFRPGSPCPPNARCIAPPPGSAYVVIRLQGGVVGIVPLTFAGDELTVGLPQDPTYDIWPASGEAMPAIGRPDLAEAPLEVAARVPLPVCGEERDDTPDRAARACFLGAVIDGRSAELVSWTVDEAGHSLVELYRYAGGGPVLVYRSASPAGPGWVRSDCAIGSANDDRFIFVVAECLSTALP